MSDQDHVFENKLEDQEWLEKLNDKTALQQVLSEIDCRKKNECLVCICICICFDCVVLD